MNNTAPPRIIGILGKSRAGKDTAAAYLDQSHGYIHLAFADALKEMAAELSEVVTHDEVRECGWETLKERPEVRQHLQSLATAARHALGPSVWVEPVIDFTYAAPREKFVVSDVRYWSEYDALQEQDATFIRITRPHHGITAGADHASETELDGAPVFRTILNDSTLDDYKNKLAVLAYELGI